MLKSIYSIFQNHSWFWVGKISWKSTTYKEYFYFSNGNIRIYIWLKQSEIKFILWKRSRESERNIDNDVRSLF